MEIIQHLINKSIWILFPNIMADRYYKRLKAKKIKNSGVKLSYDDIKENCALFLDKNKLENPKYKKDIIRDIILSYRKYGMTANEYFIYDFPKKKASERNEYLSRIRKDTLCIKATGSNWKAVLGELKDKNAFYSIENQFFLRKACRVDSKDDFKNFSDFCKNLQYFIAKPNKGACGKGVEIISLSDKSVESVFDYLISIGSYIVEEVVVQDTRILEWNSSSINTIRYPSFRNGDDFSSLFPVFRCGRKGNIVDNAGSGGVFAAIDIDSGCIITDGYDESGNIFEKHPDSQKTFKGYKIPEWETLKEFAKEVHSNLSKEHIYVGFDFALSDKGWCIIEGNWGDFILQQTALGRGFYKDFKKKLGL